MRYRIMGRRYSSGQYIIKTDVQVPLQFSYPVAIGDSGAIEAHPWNQGVFRLKPDAIELEFVML